MSRSKYEITAAMVKRFTEFASGRAAQRELSESNRIGYGMAITFLKNENVFVPERGVYKLLDYLRNTGDVTQMRIALDVGSDACRLLREESSRRSTLRDVLRDILELDDDN